MRPVHEILEACKPYLYSSTNPHGRLRICYALEEGTCPDDESEPTITDEESTAAQNVVQAAVKKLSAGYAYLRGAALERGLIQLNWDVKSAEYIAFRDKWLDDLIEEQRNAIPESPTPRNESQQ